MTQLVTSSSRFGADGYLAVGATSVPADAQINEFFTLPASFGDILMRSVVASISTFSGAYVAPAPAFDGFSFYIADASVAEQDYLGAVRYVHAGTASARPTLVGHIEFLQPRLFRTVERLYVTSPVIAGAGVTVSVTCRIMGLRLRSP